MKLINITTGNIIDVTDEKAVLIFSNSAGYILAPEQDTTTASYSDRRLHFEEKAPRKISRERKNKEG